jgi:hypothetical protein
MAENKVRQFETGATRDTNEHKPDYAGYLSVNALRAYGRYMMKHQIQKDGTRRAGDNWKKGIPMEAYKESAFRHWMDVWELLESDKKYLYKPEDEESITLEEALSALLFNIHGMLHEVTKK